MKKSLLITFAMVIFALLGSAGYIAFVPVIIQPKGAVFYLKPGTSKKVLTQELIEQGVIPIASFFEMYAFLHANQPLKSNEYLFHQGATIAMIWKQMVMGTGVYYRQFTIIPGWTFAQVRQALDRAPVLRRVTKGLTDQQIMSYLGAPNVLPEGEFYPDTYFYTRGIPDLVLLKRAYDLMQIRLTDAWNKHNISLPYANPYMALIVASLIEKEAYLNAERPVIGGVIVNRLRKNMLLQIDPTVIYGMGTRYAGKISKDNLRENTPYNTYVHKGLPPTPIAMPSEASLEAAMNPVQHDFYYFVAKGDGSHQFSKNLTDHHAAVKAAARS